MQDVPELPAVADAPDVLSGHLWLQEHVDGTAFRVQVRDAAPIRFGDATRAFDAADSPPHLRHAVHEVKRDIDRAALRRAVDDVESITFVGTATHRRHVDYDWARLPGFLGWGVWDADAGASGDWLPPDRTEQVFDSLGLEPADTVAKEVRAADFHPDSYDFPDSAWRDGPVAGIVVRNKTGGRALLENPDVLDEEAELAIDVDHELDPAEAAAVLADELPIPHLLDRVAAAIEADDARTLTFDSLQEAVLDACYREYTPTFERASVDPDAFRRAIAERTSEFIGSEG